MLKLPGNPSSQLGGRTIPRAEWGNAAPRELPHTWGCASYLIPPFYSDILVSPQH